MRKVYSFLRFFASCVILLMRLSCLLYFVKIKNAMAGYKTKTKDFIEEFIQNHKNVRFSAAELFESLKTSGEVINMATVYRNLDKLTENGKLIKSKNPSDDCCYYQYAEPSAHCDDHLHIQCCKCGKVLHLGGHEVEPFYEYLKNKMGFEINFKESTLSGLCQQCQ